GRRPRTEGHLGVVGDRDLERLLSEDEDGPRHRVFPPCYAAVGPPLSTTARSPRTQTSSCPRGMTGASSMEPLRLRAMERMDTSRSLMRVMAVRNPEASSRQWAVCARSR